MTHAFPTRRPSDLVDRRSDPRPVPCRRPARAELFGAPDLRSGVEPPRARTRRDGGKRRKDRAGEDSPDTERTCAALLCREGVSASHGDKGGRGGPQGPPVLVSSPTARKSVV